MSEKYVQEESAPEESAPEESAPEESVPEKYVQEESAPEEFVPEESVSEKYVQEESAPEESVSEEFVPEEFVPEKYVQEKSAPEEFVPEESAPEEYVSEEFVPEESVSEKYVQEENFFIEEIIIDSIYDDNTTIQSPYCSKVKIPDKIMTDISYKFEKLNENNAIEYVLNENQIENILNESKNNFQQYKFINFSKKILPDNLTKSFNNFTESIVLFQIINGNIKYIEKEGFQSRNQSIVELLNKTNNYKKLPDCAFLVFTNDFQNPKILNEPYILSFCKKYSYKTNLFPNFNFNHWKEANIDNYEDVYNHFKKNQINWSNKNDIIYWRGANTNILREKIYKSTKDNNKFSINLINKDDKYIPIYECIKYKYLLNINGYSYAGRLNYLFMSGSCIIILKNEDKEKDYEEFFYKYFIPGVDYIEILYNDNENINNIIEKINTSLLINDTNIIAQNCYKKAVQVFEMNNIYEYIYDLLTHISSNCHDKKLINNNIMYSPKSLYFLENRLIVRNNIINFKLKAFDLELILEDLNKQSIISIKLFNNTTNINFNNSQIFNKYTPLIINNNVQQNYEISIINNQLTITLITTKTRFALVKIDLPINDFIITNNKIKTENGGWWII